MLKTLKTIILSRFTKPNEDEEVLRKRKICKVCEYNSLNVKEISRKKKILKKLSDFYSWITGNLEDDNLGLCNFCGCSIYYKILMDDDCKKGKWKTNV